MRTFFSAKMWKQIDNLVHQSVHACESNQVPGCVETPDMELASLPDHVNKGLQYIQSYQSRSQIPNPDPAPGPAHQMSAANLRQISHRNLDPCKFENDTGVELTHNRDPLYSKFNNVVDVIAYMDQTQYDNVSFTDDSANMSNTPTNKSALQRRYRIKRPPLPPPSKKMKNVPWVKIADETIGIYLYYNSHYWFFGYLHVWCNQCNLIVRLQINRLSFDTCNERVLCQHMCTLVWSVIIMINGNNYLSISYKMFYLLTPFLWITCAL